MDKKILEHFKKNDPLLYSFALKISLVEVIIKTNSGDYFTELCEIIVGQQLSSKAADAIFAKFEKLYPGGIRPEKVLKTSHEKLRKSGLSNSKAKYLKFLAQAVVERKLQLNQLDSLSDSDVIKQLTKVKGIGPWTAEIFLMFTLGRPDVYSHGDLGLRKALKRIYKLKKDPSIRTVEKIIRKWSPYKTYGARILWKTLEKY